MPSNETGDEPGNETADEGAKDELAKPVATAPRAGRRPLTRLAFLVFGVLVALYVGTLAPREQHVRVVLGAAAPVVTGVDLQYLTADGEVAVEAHFAYARGAAPRVVAHEPKLRDGAYRLQIDVDAQGGRRAIQRQVTLGGGSTQVDVSSVLLPEDRP